MVPLSHLDTFGICNPDLDDLEQEIAYKSEIFHKNEFE